MLKNNYACDYLHYDLALGLLRPGIIKDKAMLGK